MSRLLLCMKVEEEKRLIIQSLFFFVFYHVICKFVQVKLT